MSQTHLKRHKKTISVLATNNVTSIRLPPTKNLKRTEGVKFSILGTRIVDNITFPAGTYVGLDGQVVTYQKIGLDSVGVVISQRNNIVKTRISGKNGTVKEYINRDDYHIRCEAILTNPPVNIFGVPNIVTAISQAASNVVASSKTKNVEREFYPVDEAVDILRRISSSNREIPVISTLLNETFEINNVVFEDINYNYPPGTEDVIVNFTMLSDDDLNLDQFNVVDEQVQQQLVSFGVFSTTA